MATFLRHLRQRLDDLTIGRRLILGFLVILACMAAVVVFGVYQMNRLADMTARLYRHPLAVSNAVRDVHINILRIHRSLRDMALAPDQRGVDAAAQAIEHSAQLVGTAVAMIRERFLGDQRDVDDLVRLFQEWQPLQDEVLTLARAGRSEDAAAIMQGRGQEHLARLEKELQDVTDFAGHKAAQFLSNAGSTASQAYGLTLGLLAASVAAGLAIAARISRRITQPLRQAAQIAAQVSQGDLTGRFTVASRDEVGQVLAAMQQMIAYIQEAAAVAEKISDQQLDVTVAPKSSRDMLNQALQRMIVNLRAMLADINRALNETAQQNWLKDGLNQLNASVLGDRSLRNIGTAAVSFVARYVNAGHAVLYAYADDDHILRLSGAFALTEHDQAADTYRLGEGVIGQAARDRAPIFLEHPQRTAQVITTGLVSAAPSNTYTLPLIYNDDLYGVLEVAAFEPLDAAKQRFLDEAGPVLATILFSALQRERVQTLLEQSQQAAHEAGLAVREAQDAKAEAQQHSAELQRANTRLEEQQQRLQQQSEELRQINVHLEEQQHAIQEQRDHVQERELRLQQAQTELEHRTRALETANHAQIEKLLAQVAELRDPLHGMLATLAAVAAARQSAEPDAAQQLQQAHQAGERVLEIIRAITASVPINASDGHVHAKASASDEVSASDEASASDNASTAAESPAVDETPAPRIDDDRQEISPGDVSILIIEDNVDIGQSLVEIIRGMGFRALIAVSGYDGLALAARFRPTGILLDLILPDLNGVEVLRELKRTRELRGIPVHVMSAKDRDEVAKDRDEVAKDRDEAAKDRDEAAKDRDEVAKNRDEVAKNRDEVALKAGAIGFARKPMSADDVRAVVQRLFQESRNTVRRVLIVEDHEAQREAIRQLLGEHAALETTGVDSKAAALREIDSGRYDAAIIDLGLQDGSGLDICRYVKAQAIDLPLIIYTGKDLAEDEERELRQYTDSIIIKTAYSYERLQDEVLAFLQQVTPGEAGASAAAPAQPAASLDLHGKKILVVDDDVKNVFVLASVLEEHGATILDARNGREALEKLHAEDDIALVLMDVMMPLMDGYETMRAIRRDPRSKELPIVAITAKTLLEDRLQCIEAGADDYLTKPVDYDNLLRLVSAWLDQD